MRSISRLIIAVLTCGVAIETQADIVKEVGRKRAFLVGAKEPNGGDLPKLNWTTRDVERLAELLEKRCGYQGTVEKLINPDKKEVEVKFKAFLATVTPFDTVVVYFSCHGDSITVNNTQDVSLLMIDSTKNPDTCILSSHITSGLDNLFKTKTEEQTADNWSNLRKILIMDCCHAGTGGVANLNNINPAQLLRNDIKNLAVFCSCRDEESSYEWAENEHGFFTWYLMEGLQGRRNPGRGRDILLTELSTYVGDQVLSKTQEVKGFQSGQTPVLFPPLPANFAIASPQENYWRETTTGMPFLRIEPGKFEMGSRADEEGRDPNEMRHEVHITQPFRLGVFEVTNAEYYKHKANGKKQVGNNQPVVLVTWYDAIEYCNRMSAANGLAPCYLLGNVKYDSAVELRCIEHADVKYVGGAGFRLPTEAEWEYACRAGSRTATGFGFTLDWNRAVYDGRRPYSDAKLNVVPIGPKPDRTVAVGRLGFPNFWGLHDMHGNVAEWCHDSYEKDYYKTRQPGDRWVDPRGPRENLTPPHVTRGGGFIHAGVECRSAARSSLGNGGDLGAIRMSFVGFRVAQSLPEVSAN